ncbi:shikimate kinase AroK [Acinetobacter sp. B5B]|nr:shikimate kinase AroK [Acinetobacter baretiae]MBF7682217.1 shikimate kinase AroK [Acinetobacter baretiae]MBF7685044.1 shikimate kinase AroK [Acinetobacter baretiae]
MPKQAIDTLPNIYLVGPMGAGKTTVGRHLAEILGREFIDSDHEIETKTGASIPWIFEKEGELGFRQREKQVLEELTQLNNVVLATGGGAVTQQENRQVLRTSGVVVYLFAPVEIQLQRTYRDKNRPLLQVDYPEKRLQELLEMRDPLYKAVAHYIVDTHSGAARDLAYQILSNILENPQT